MNLRDRLPGALDVLAKAAFLGAAGFALWSALIPADDSSSLFPWDKLAHFTAFYVIALLAIPAFPRLPLVAVGLGLTGLGVLIEILQALPIVNRDSDWKDVVADLLGIGAALAPALAWRLRELPAARAPEATPVVDLTRRAERLKGRA